MPTVVPVKFAYSTHELWFDPGETGAMAADHVICSTERGTECGLVVRDAFEVPEEELGDTLGEATLKPVLRVATEADLVRADELAQKGEDALPIFRRLVEKSGLDMKPVGVEYLFGGEKAVCYFAAEERVDFRALVRDLSHELQERIDMRQIGVREEAAIVGGYAHCGQELCCRRFGKQFEPVSIRMAKEQDLPLNSNKISGACGRLMCCLRYEFEAYRDFKSRAPKKNAVIDTPLGKAKIVEYDTPKEQLCLRLENGKQIRVPLAEMQASPAAHKKSEELGCACRPDTVLRETLDKILTPDIQMALAELDRKYADGQEELEVEKVVLQSRKPRREHGAAPMTEATVSAQAHDAQGVEENKAQEAQPKPKSRRRRKKTAGSAQPEAREGTKDAGEQQAGAAGARRRRHHRSAAAGTVKQVAAGSAKARGDQAESSSERPRKRTRRPGDKGGRAQSAESAPKASSSRSSRPAHASAGAQAAGQGSGQKSGEQRARRRRHRTNKPAQGHGAQE